MSLSNQCRDMNLKEVYNRCKDIHNIPDLKKAVFPLVKGGCPHYCIIYRENKWRLLYAGVSRHMNLECALKFINILRSRKEGTHLIEDSGLTSAQVLMLTCYGYGVTVALSLNDYSLELLTLTREDDCSFDVVSKNIFTIALSE